MKRIILMLLSLCIMLCGCGASRGDRQDKQGGSIGIVTTIFPLYDFARAIMGNDAHISLLIKPGSEVHSFDPSPSDISAVYNADLFIYIGGESDAWVNRVLSDVNVSTLPLISVVEGISGEGHEETHHHTHAHTFDEHIWTSPKNAIIMLERICESIIAADPENEVIYRKNCDKYIQRLRQADSTLREVITGAEKKFLLMADRFPFAYFAEYYGLEYEAAFGGCAVSSDISLKTMVRLTETVKKKELKAAFYVEMSNKTIANALAEQTGVTLLQLHSAHNVTLDEFKSGITYADILENNAISLERGLR